MIAEVSSRRVVHKIRRTDCGRAKAIDSELLFTLSPIYPPTIFAYRIFHIQLVILIFCLQIFPHFDNHFFLLFYSIVFLVQMPIFPFLGIIQQVYYFTHKLVPTFNMAMDSDYSATKSTSYE